MTCQRPWPQRNPVCGRDDRRPRGRHRTTRHRASTEPGLDGPDDSLSNSYMSIDRCARLSVEIMRMVVRTRESTVEHYLWAWDSFRRRPPATCGWWPRRPFAAATGAEPASQYGSTTTPHDPADHVRRDGRIHRPDPARHHRRGALVLRSRAVTRRKGVLEKGAAIPARRR